MLLLVSPVRRVAQLLASFFERFLSVLRAFSVEVVVLLWRCWLRHAPVRHAELRPAWSLKCEVVASLRRERLLLVSDLLWKWLSSVERPGVRFLVAALSFVLSSEAASPFWWKISRIVATITGTTVMVREL